MCVSTVTRVLDENAELLEQTFRDADQEVLAVYPAGILAAALQVGELETAYGQLGERVLVVEKDLALAQEDVRRFQTVYERLVAANTSRLSVVAQLQRDLDAAIRHYGNLLVYPDDVRQMKQDLRQARTMLSQSRDNINGGQRDRDAAILFRDSVQKAHDSAVRERHSYYHQQLVLAQERLKGRRSELAEAE
jgi:hypothetical protein